MDRNLEVYFRSTDYDIDYMFVRGFLELLYRTSSLYSINVYHLDEGSYRSFCISVLQGRSSLSIFHMQQYSTEEKEGLKRCCTCHYCRYCHCCCSLAVIAVKKRYQGICLNGLQLSALSLQGIQSEKVYSFYFKYLEIEEFYIQYIITANVVLNYV